MERMILSDIITSEVRAKLLIVLFSETKKDLYVRELTRRVGTEINAIRRELKRLLAAGIIRKEQRGNRIYYLVREDYSLYPELVSITTKEAGVGKELINNYKKFGHIKLMLLSFRFAKGQPPKEKELDLLIIGTPDKTGLDQMIKKVGLVAEREINYTVLSGEEFKHMMTRRESFLLNFLLSKTISLVGNLDDVL